MIALIAVVMCGAALAEAPAATAIDFEDGVFAFVGMDSVKGNADASVLSVVDYNGSKALKVESQGKVPYVAFNLEGLLGENIAKLNAVSFDAGCDLGADGKFYAVSGKVYGYVTGEDGKLAEKTRRLVRLHGEEEPQGRQGGADGRCFPGWRGQLPGDLQGGRQLRHRDR